MSDVATAPAAAPSAPAAPAASEVAVNTNPINVPNPIGSQAPQRQELPADFKGSEHRTESRRESIQKAFERARRENPPQARQAKIGDNNPPEETKREKPEPKREDAIDLRKRPSEQQEKAPSPRGDHGHFASREGAQNDAQTRANNAQNAQPAQNAQRPGQQQQPGYTRPVPRMSPQAQAEWAKTPPSVQADVHRMHHEFGRAFQHYRGDHEAMNRLRPYAKMAQQSGTSLDRALDAYTGMEHKLRNDVVGGLDLIVDNLNLRAQDGQKLTLRDVAWHIINQTPEQQQLLQSRNTSMAQSHQLQAANQRIAQLENLAKQFQYERQFVHTRQGVDQYAAAHPRLDELGDLIEQEVKLGFDLDTAYRRAEMLRPAGTVAQTHGTAAQTRTTSAQTRTDRSISGAPGSSSNGNGARQPKQVGRREAIANAIKRASANGSL